MKTNALLALCPRPVGGLLLAIALTTPGIAFAACSDKLETLGTLYYMARLCPGEQWNDSIKTRDLFADGIKFGLLTVEDTSEKCLNSFFTGVGSASTASLEDPSKFTLTCSIALAAFKSDKSPYASLNFVK